MIKKIKLLEIYNSKNALQNLMKEKMSISLNYDINKLIKTVEVELNYIENQRNLLVNKYSTDNSVQKKVDEDKMEFFVKEFNELLLKEIEFNFNPISTKALNLEKICISGIDFYCIECFLNKDD